MKPPDQSEVPPTGAAGETPTPRTDASCFTANVEKAPFDATLYDVVPTDFARTLERELADLRAALAQAQEQGKRDGERLDGLKGLLTECGDLFEEMDGVIWSSGSDFNGSTYADLKERVFEVLEVKTTPPPPPTQEGKAT